MAITKVNRGAASIQLILNADGTVRQVMASVRTVVAENGKDTNIALTQDVDLWPQLTAAQQTSLQTVVTRLGNLASSLDVAFPVPAALPIPGHGPLGAPPISEEA